MCLLIKERCNPRTAKKKNTAWNLLVLRKFVILQSKTKQERRNHGYIH